MENGVREPTWGDLVEQRDLDMEHQTSLLDAKSQMLAAAARQMKLNNPIGLNYPAIDFSKLPAEVQNALRPGSMSAAQTPGRLMRQHVPLKPPPVSSLRDVCTADLVMELLGRGYAITKIQEQPE